MDLAKLKDLTAAIQSLSVAVAVLVGGAWALYRFMSLKEVKKATAQLKQLQKELLERGILKLDMVTVPIGRTTSDRPVVSVDVSVQNTGNRTEVIGWDRSRLQATLIQLKGDKPEYSAAVVGRYEIAGSDRTASSVLPGQLRTFPILLVLPRPGLYQLVFSAVVSPVEFELQAAEHRGAGHEVEEVHWTAARYYVAE